MVLARPHLPLRLALFAASFALALAFAATSRAEDTTLTPDAGTTTATDDAGAVPTPTDPAPRRLRPIDTDRPTVPPPPTGAAPTDPLSTDRHGASTDRHGASTDPGRTADLPPPTDTPTADLPTDRTWTAGASTDRHGASTDRLPPTVPPPTDTVPSTDRARYAVRHTVPWEVQGPSPDGAPVASPIPVSDALVTVAFGSPRSSPPAVNDLLGPVGRGHTAFPRSSGAASAPQRFTSALGPLCRRPQVSVALRVEDSSSQASRRWSRRCASAWLAKAPSD